MVGSLDEKQVEADPISQFSVWFKEALNAEVNEVNAMVLSTVDRHHKPHARIVLLKDIIDGAFTFYTNYNSHKGEEIAANPNVSLLFFWSELERQVRIEGTISKIDRATSGQYFHSRPRGSQIGAHVSPQSQAIQNREWLEKRWEEFEKKFEGGEVPLPDYWGGYSVKPSLIEFWQGRPSRLHDRILYTYSFGLWQIERLAP